MSNVLLQMDAKELALRCRDLADSKKAENIVILDVRDVSSITDYFVVATGTSEPHLRAIVQAIRDSLEAENGLSPRATDGSLHTAWVVLDYFDVIVHVMRGDVRDHYALEALWSDAPRVRGSRKRRALKAPGQAAPGSGTPSRKSSAPPS